MTLTANAIRRARNRRRKLLPGRPLPTTPSRMKSASGLQARRARRKQSIPISTAQLKTTIRRQSKATRIWMIRSIDYSAKNGTLVLKGSVKTEAQKREAAKLANDVPQRSAGCGRNRSQAGQPFHAQLLKRVNDAGAARWLPYFSIRS